MDLNWILLGIDAALVFAMAVTWVLVIATRHDRERLLSEAADLRRSLETLRSDVDRWKAEAQQAKAPQAATFATTATLNTDRRAEALEMLRSGMDAGAVTARLRLSRAEATLLGKVHSLLAPVSPAGNRAETVR